MKLCMQAWNNLDEAKRDSVTKQYMAEEQKRRSYDSARKVSAEEVAAAYAEDVFNNSGAWDYILSEEPSLKDRVIAFFKGSPKRYSFAPEMDAAAKKWLQEYKKIFDQVAARNAGMNVLEDVTTVDKKEEIKKIGKLVDALGGGAATQVPKSVIKRIGKVVTNNNAEGNKKTATGTENVRDSGERDAVALNENNVPFVVVGDDILDGVSEKDWIKTVKENLLQKYPDGITLKNNTVVIDRQSRKELTFSKYMQWLKKNNPDAFSDKLRATNNVDEILLAATDWISDGLNHPRKDNIVDFAKGNVLIRVGANDYSATVIVGTRKNGTMLLYDIINLQKTTIKQKKTVEAEPVNPSRGVERKTSTIFDSSISQKSQNSNTSDKNSSKKFDSSERSALADGKRATAGEVAAMKSAISKRGIDPKGIIAIADRYFARYSGQLTKTESQYIKIFNG